MNLALLLPAALAALAALVLPLAIHLARRSETVPTDFAALRWLRQKPRPRQRLRFDEWLLLVARLLLFALLALWLARPVLEGEAGEARRVVVVPGAAVTAADAEAGHRWLSPGFPALDATPEPRPPVASLLRQLDAELPPETALTVVVPAAMSGADAERPRLSRAVEWRIVPGAMPAAAPPPAAVPVLDLRGGAVPGLRYLRAAATAWQPPGRLAALTVADPAAPLSDATLVWLAPGALSAEATRWIERGGTALLASTTPLPGAAPVVIWRDALGAPLVEAARLGDGRVLRFVRPLTPAAMPELLDPGFPQALRDLLAPPAPQPARVFARDHAPLTGGPAPSPAARDLQPWLALAIAALFAVERWLATRRRRGVAP